MDAAQDADEARSSAGRALAAARWGDAAVRRAATVVIARHDELPADLREQVHQVTGEPPSDG